MQALIILFPLNTDFIDITIADEANPSNPINDCTVNGVLYQNRSLTSPETEPGSPVPGYTAISFTFLANGVYEGSLRPAPDLIANTIYVLVVDATSAGTNYVGHWEFPVKVLVRNGTT